METPLLLCVFNRPELTRQVFRVVRRQRPQRLLIVGDGPRHNHPDDAQRVAEVRAIVTAIDWPCQVETNFAHENMGCRQRMASGISWALQRCECVVVLEDDCLPCDAFFPYCSALLERYAEHPRIMMVSGDNFQRGPRSAHSYYFSKFAHIWGWGTWRRAWQHYDVDMRQWGTVRHTDWIERVTDSPAEAQFWRQQFDAAYQGQIDTWDFAWMFACWQRNGLTILPQVNLVTNMGFGADATHTVDGASPLAGLPTGQIETPLVHPPHIERDVEADAYTWNTVFRPMLAAAPDSAVERSWWPWPRRTRSQVA